MSSYELLELLEFMPEQGAFKTAAERGGRWTTSQLMLAEAVNEAYRLRSVYQLVNGGEDASFDTSDWEFLDPVARRDRDRRDEEEAEAARVSQDEFYAGMGWTTKGG